MVFACGGGGGGGNGGGVGSGGGGGGGCGDDGGGGGCWHCAQAWGWTRWCGSEAASGVAAAARVVVVVRSVVEVATEAASVVKVVAAEEMTAVDEGGGRGGAPIATPNTRCGVWGAGGMASQRNLHAIGGVKKHRCLSGRDHRHSLFGWRAIARHPILSGQPARTRGLSEERRDCARTLRGTCVQPREQWRAVAGGRRMLTWKVNQVSSISTWC